MRKKPPPPSPTATPSPPSPDDQHVGADVLEQILFDNLDPANSVTPMALGSMFEMVLALAYDKKVERVFFMETMDKALRGISLLENFKAEYRLVHALDVPPEQKQALTSALDLSLKEIKHIRLALCEKFLLMRQCKPKAELNS